MPTEKEKQEALVMLKQAAELARKYGPMIHDECQGPRQAITALAIIIGSLSVACGVSMHTLMGVIMEVYKRTSDGFEDNNEDH